MYRFNALEKYAEIFRQKKYFVLWIEMFQSFIRLSFLTRFQSVLFFSSDLIEYFYYRKNSSMI